MAERLRRAGHGRFVDGTDVTWSVAEGRKGRRWREVRSRGGVVVSSLLLETFPDGRFAHLEASTAAGLLTLHPEGDGTLHGNAVLAEGVRHVVGLPWPPGSVVVLDGSAIAIAAAAWFIREASPSTDPAGRLPVVMIDPALGVKASSIPADGLSHDKIDADGLPILDDAETWPLELELEVQGG
ncbi:MAG TPA: hypothetical protein VFV72_17125 [Candidatus Limnocylindrales bacterium]|nr:hypothetical protein [Candidatus Limnocylindrales bacterium]